MTGKRVLTAGVFDLLHIGHVELFRKAKALGDYLIVAVQESDFIRKYKPEAEIVYNTEERMYLIRVIRFVNEVVSYTDIDKIIHEVDFDVFAVGPDQTHPGFQRVMQWCRENGKEVVVLPRTEGISTSELKRMIKES